MSDRRVDNLPPTEDELPEGFDAAPKPVADPGYEAVKVSHECPEQAVYFTVVLTAGQPVQNLLPRDPDRLQATIIALDNPVVIAESLAKAESVANQTASVPAPQGGFLPVGIRLPVRHTKEAYVAATTTATNSRVFVLVEKR
jgi:hypothetical protein